MNVIECEECEERVPVQGDPMRRATFYVVTTLDNSEVGHYCSPEHAQLGIAAWDESMKSEAPPEDDE